MKIKVRLVLQLARFAPRGRPDFTLNVEDGIRVGTVVERLGLRPTTPRVTAINGRRVGEDHQLGDGDELLIFPPATGG